MAPVPDSRGERAGPAGASPGADLRRTVLAASARVEGIIDAAEEAAKLIRAEAEEQARALLERRHAEAERAIEARVGELAERIGPLTERIERMRSEAAVLAAELEELVAAARAAAPGAPPAQPEPATPPAQAAPAASAGLVGEAPAAGEDPATPTSSGVDQALLRATQMAVAGSGRDEIERVLRDELGVADPGPVLDRVLGPA